jgi:hypothetical protein
VEQSFPLISCVLNDTYMNHMHARVVQMSTRCKLSYKIAQKVIREGVRDDTSHDQKQPFQTGLKHHRTVCLDQEQRS